MLNQLQDVFASLEKQDRCTNDFLIHHDSAFGIANDFYLELHGLHLDIN